MSILSYSVVFLAVLRPAPDLILLISADIVVKFIC